MQNLLVTCDLASELPLILLGVGATHSSPVAIYGEADHQAVAFAVHAINLATFEKLETGMVAPTVNDGLHQVLLLMELPPGRWLLGLESVAKGVIARREIKVRDERQQESENP